MGSYGVHRTSKAWTSAALMSAYPSRAGLCARVRRARGGRNGGRSWSGWLPCSARGRRLTCRHGARRLRTYGGARRRGAAARCPPRSGGGSPVAVAEVVEVEVPTAEGREKELTVTVSTELVE